MDLMARRRAMSGQGSASGGGSITLASGTYTGDGRYQASIPIGTIAAQTDFAFLLWADPSTEYPYDGNYKVARFVSFCPSDFMRFDLSTDGDHFPVSALDYDINDAGTVTTKSLTHMAQNSLQLQKDNIQTADFQAQRTKIIRSSTGFRFFVNASNAAYQFLSGATYIWKLVYYGSNPATDIITI